MAVPKTKIELLQQSQDNYKKLIDLIASLTQEQQQSEFPEGTLNRNIRDVLAHLHHWHLMMLGWYKVGMKGDKPDMPAKGYTWRTTPDLNRAIWEKYKNAELGKITTAFKKSHFQVQEIIQRHSNKELFEKKRYKWTGSSSLGTYFRANTSSHYNWAYKLIKKANLSH